MTKTALTGVRVFDGHRLTEPRTVVIDGQVIGTDPTGAQEIDAQGAVLLPGLIDAHVHVTEREHLDNLATWGVTTGLDMGCWPAERVASLRGLPGTADFRSAGLPAIGAGGFHAQVLLKDVADEAVIRTPEDARKHVEARVAEGVDYIKGIAEAPGDGGPTAESLQALVETAHMHGLKTVIHAASVGAYTVATGTGTDFITHTPRGGVVKPEDVAGILAAGQIVVPTLTMLEGFLEDKSSLLDSVTALHQAGVRILAGTDSHAASGVPFSVPHGPALHHELELMVQAGMSPVEVLRSATVLTAQAFGLADRGAVEPGLRADLVLLDGDPTADITATQKIRAVWCAGQPKTVDPAR